MAEDHTYPGIEMVSISCDAQAVNNRDGFGIEAPAENVPHVIIEDSNDDDECGKDEKVAADEDSNDEGTLIFLKPYFVRWGISLLIVAGGYGLLWIGSHVFDWVGYSLTPFQEKVVTGPTAVLFCFLCSIYLFAVLMIIDRLVGARINGRS